MAQKHLDMDDTDALLHQLEVHRKADPDHKIAIGKLVDAEVSSREKDPFEGVIVQRQGESQMKAKRQRREKRHQK